MLIARNRSPGVRGRRPRSARDFIRLFSTVHHERGTAVRPGQDFRIVANSSSEVIAIELMAGRYTLYEEMLLDVDGLHLYGKGHAVFERVTAFSGAMLRVTAASALVSGITFDDDAGAGNAVQVDGDDCTLEHLWILTGPGTVAIGDGIHVKGDRCLVFDCHVATSLPARPNGEIWYADTATEGRLLANSCPGGVISVKGTSGVVHAANVPSVTLRP